MTKNIHDQYVKRAILYIDLLGYKRLILNKTKLGEDVIRGQLETHQNFERSGFIEVKKESIRYKPDATFVSDSIVFGYKYEEAKNNHINPIESLIKRAPELALRYFLNGILVRGAITVGDMYQGENNCIGYALCRACELEAEFSMPAIVIDIREIDITKELPESYRKSIISSNNGTCDKEYHIVDTIYHMGWAHQNEGKKMSSQFITHLENIRNHIDTNIKHSDSKVKKKWEWFAEYYKKSLISLEKDFPIAYQGITNKLTTNI